MVENMDEGTMPSTFYPKYCRSVGCYKCPVPKAHCRSNYCARRVGSTTSRDWNRFIDTHCRVQWITGEWVSCPHYSDCYRDL